MKKQKFPPGWDEKRVNELIAHYENQTEDEEFADIQAAREPQKVCEMVQPTNHVLADLYEVDETAWLEATADLVRSGLWDQIDARTLAEYLTDMALRDKRETLSRLTTLIAHLLKWRFQPENRGSSWRVTVERDRQELEDLLESGTLHNHAQEVLAKAYRRAVKQAIAETRLPEEMFSRDCPWSLDAVLAEPLSE